MAQILRQAREELGDPLQVLVRRDGAQRVDLLAHRVLVARQVVGEIADLDGDQRASGRHHDKRHQGHDQNGGHASEMQAAEQSDARRKNEAEQDRNGDRDKDLTPEVQRRNGEGDRDG